jgi:tetratricopeptide (TPR) repeat protein
VTIDFHPSDAETENAFFERGVAEERATLAALAKRPAIAQREARAIQPRRAVAVLALALLGLGAFSGLKAARSRVPSQAAIVPEPSSGPEGRPVAEVPSPQPSSPGPVTDVAKQERLVANSVGLAPQATERPSATNGSIARPIEAGAASACKTAIAARRFREMLAVCEDATRSEGEGASLALQVANIELERGRTASALSWAHRTLKADPNLAEPYVIIGSVEQESGRLSAARDAYSRYLAMAPKGRYASELRAIMRAR